MVSIYGIVFRNEVIYVGNSQNVKERFLEHLAKARKGSNLSPLLYEHMRKNKLKGYSLQIIELVDMEQKYEREIYWINHYKTRESGCNKTAGGISASGSGHYMWGKKAHPQAVKASIEFRKGKPMPQAWKDAIGKGNRNKGPRNNTPVICTTTGEEFTSILACANHYGVSMFTIQMIVKGKSDPNARRKLKGFDFKVIDPVPKEHTS